MTEWSIEIIESTGRYTWLSVYISLFNDYRRDNHYIRPSFNLYGKIIVSISACIRVYNIYTGLAQAI